MKKLLKGLFVMVLAATLITMVGCGKKEDPNKTPGGDQTQTTGGVDVKVEDAKLSNMLKTGKLYVTSFGQADKTYMDEAVAEACGEKVEYTFDPLLDASNVKTGDMVIAVVGFTSKGLAVGVTQATELARAEAFAKLEGVTLVICQLSGKERRGTSSDPIISAAVAGADLVLINKGANSDNQYSNVWCKDKTLFQFTDEWDMVDYIKVIVGA